MIRAIQIGGEVAVMLAKEEGGKVADLKMMAPPLPMYQKKYGQTKTDNYKPTTDEEIH